MHGHTKTATITFKPSSLELITLHIQSHLQLIFSTV